MLNTANLEAKLNMSGQNMRYWALQPNQRALSLAIQPKQVKMPKLNIVGGQSSLLHTVVPNTTNPLILGIYLNMQQKL